MKWNTVQHVYGSSVSAEFDLWEPMQGLMRSFREVYYINLQENYYYILYPKPKDGTVRRNYKEMVFRYLESGAIPEEEMKRMWQFLQPLSIRQALRCADTAEYQYRRRTSEGETEWCMATFSLCRHSGTEVESVILSIRSIEKLIRGEEQQRNALEQALLQARNENQAKTAFLSAMSHDIRTPMNAIIGFTDLARNHMNEPERVKGYLDKIALSSGHLLGLINDVLELSKIESGKLELQKKPKSIRRMLTKLHEILKEQAEKKAIEFHVICNEVQHDLIWADELRIEQMLLNLAGNALKYTPEGGRVIVRIVEQETNWPAYGKYLITIQDNGIGISPQYLPRIFEAFSRDENTAVHQNEGTGLGLSITKAIVKLLGGTIDAESTPGEGTCFTVRMSFMLAKGLKEEVSEAASEPEDKAAGNFSGKTVLLAEDDLFSAEIATEYLKDMGFMVERVSNGREIIDRLLSKNPGTYFCILLDLHMPVLDGISAAKEIRALSDPWLSGIPIIAMTADAFEEDRRRTQEAGMNGHITKPVDRNALQSALLQLRDL